MLLLDLLDRAGGRPGLTDLVPSGGADLSVDIAAVVADSRQAGPGALFCCVPGAHVDGHDHAPAAVASGAVALLCERPLGLGVPELVVPSVRAGMGSLAAAFHGDPSRRMAVIGVTGTNGKTTVTHLVQAVLEAAGRPCGLIGTLTGARTTPEAPDLQADFAGFEQAGRQAVAMEVSSHALAQHRVDGTWFTVAAFTNLSQDHLDYHLDMESYFAAKASLFEPGRVGRAVVCRDDEWGRRLLDDAAVPSVAYSVEDATEIEVRPDGTEFVWRGTPVRTRLAGRFNLANAVAAATIAEALDVPMAAIVAGLASAEPVRGRFELVEAGQPFLVAVDYAHTPDGLANALAAARELAGVRRVLVVFGCGGDRDAAKRPMMGAAAAAGADVSVLTTDNPRSEDPHAIIDDVLRGFPPTVRPEVEPDRRSAIRLAFDRAAPGDVVVIAGKGHEATQVLGDTEVPFDDRVVATEELTR